MARRISPGRFRQHRCTICAAALENPFVREQDRVWDFERPGAVPVRMVATPVRSDGSLPRQAAPALGADTDAVLRDCGLSDSDIVRLRAAKVI